jgi:hypothetical protein
VLPCHYDPHWQLNTLTFPGFVNLLNTWRFKVLSTDGVNGVKNF